VNVAHAQTERAARGGVKLSWIDQSNHEFSSALIGQPEESFFQILSSEEFHPNESGDRTRLLHVKMNVLLSDGKETKRMVCDKAVLAVGYR
jgi:hypothetical protein